jgi:hypothetical protein
MNTQNTASPHTPTPWHRQGFTVFAQRNPGGRKIYICDVSQDAGFAVSPANAAFIVTACNSHDKLTADKAALVAALEWALSQLPDGKSMLNDESKLTDYDTSHATARAALAGAKE